MFFGRQQDSDISLAQRKSPGIKIVDNKINKRVSDIFNVKEQVTFHKPENYYEIKKISKQSNEERMNNKLRVIYFLIFLEYLTIYRRAKES